MSKAELLQAWDEEIERIIDNRDDLLACDEMEDAEELLMQLHMVWQTPLRIGKEKK